MKIDNRNSQQSEHGLLNSHYPRKKAFTLIEIVIVLITAAILIGILFRVYTTTADIALRIKHQKQL
jgi:type II secretory pathway pseudopilin PulG